MDLKRFSRWGIGGSLAGILVSIASCDSQVRSGRIEKYSLLGHAQFDLDSNPVSTTFPRQRLSDMLVERGICATAEDANLWIEQTGLGYDADSRGSDIALVSDTYDQYDYSMEDPSISARLHAETMQSLGNARIFLYTSGKPLDKLTLEDALQTAKSQKGYRAIPMDLRVPEKSYAPGLSLTNYNDILEKANRPNASEGDREALIDIRDVDKPLNFAPVGSTWIVASEKNNYSAFTITGRKDIGPYSEDRPFAQDYHRGWKIDIDYKRLAD